MKKSLLEGLIQILTEAPMSDEDREDSEKLRQIFNKRSGRSNAKLTADEKSLLDKYGLSIEGRWVSSEDGRPFSSGNVDRLLKIGNTRGHFDKNNKWRNAEYNNDKVNFADMARKQPERRYAQGVKDTWYDSDAAGHGGDKKRYYSDSDVTFQERERVRTTQDSEYQKDLENMSWALRDRNSANKKLQNYDNERKAIDDKYEKALSDAKRRRENDIAYLDNSNEYSLKDRARANQSISDIKDKYRRN